VRADAGVHAHRHLGPGLAGQRDLPADSRGPAARVALRHLPHADQRVAPAPQRELLQVPGQRPVTRLHRLEDPPAQPPYLLLMATPVHTLPGITIERGQALRSVHRSAQRARQFRHLRSLRLKGSPAHVSALAGPSITLAIRPVIRAPSGRRPGPAALAFPLPFGRRHSLPGHPVPPAGFRPSYDRPTGRPAPTRACRTDPGEVSTFRTHETRTGPDALYTPGTVVFAGRRPIRGRRLPPLSGRSLAPRYNDPARDVSVTRHQQGFPDSRPVPVLPLTCEPPWLERRPSGFPVSSAPSRSGTGHARHGGDRSNTDL